MKKSYLKIALLALIITACSSLFGQSKAYADTYCGLLPAILPAYLSSPNPCNTPPWPASQQPYNALNDLLNISSNTQGYQSLLKSAFINDMSGFDTGQSAQQVGAKYIEAKISGTSGLNWATRLNLSDISLSISKYSYTSNSGYDYTNKAYVAFGETGTVSALIFKTPDGVTRLVLKIGCGNILDEMPNIPSPPIIYASKVNELGDADKGYYSSDTISATVGSQSAVASDTSSPAALNVQSGTATVTAANSAAGYTVSGYYTFTCVNNGSSPPSSCSNTASFVPLNSPPYTYTFTVKTGYVYSIKWKYKVETPNITVTKVSSDGSSGDFTSDTINVDSFPQSSPTYSTGNPSTFTVPIGGPANISAQNSLKDYSITGYTWCDSTTPGCDGTSLPSPSGLISPTLSITPIAGRVYYVDAVYKPIIPPVGSSNCPHTNIVDTTSVPVTLTDNTPGTRANTAPAAATSANNPLTTNWPEFKIGEVVATDISVGGSTLVLANPKTGTGANYLNATVDYTPFVTTYPYDTNQAQVTYNTYYDSYNWISSSYATSSTGGYTCPPPDSGYSLTSGPTGGTCYYSAPGTTSGNGTASTCYVRGIDYGSMNQLTCTGLGGKWTAATSSTASVCTTALINGQCIVQATKAVTGSAATYYYSYSPQGATVYGKSVSGHVDVLPVMTACYPRKFSVSSIQSSSVSLNNYENPTQATASNYSAVVNFKYDPSGPQGVSLRQPMALSGLKYNYNFTVSGCSGSGLFNQINGSYGAGTSQPSPVSIPSATCNSVRVPPLSPGNTVCANYSITGSSGDVDSSGTITNATDSISSSSSCSGPVVNEPYFKVFGGDITVGNGFGNSCPTNNNSGIFGWTTGTAAPYPQYVGAGAQYILASPSSQQVAYSNQYNPNGTSSSPQALSLANYTVSCMPDYLSGSSAATTSAPSSDLSQIPTGTYSMSGGSSISGTVVASKHIVIYVKGDLNISGDITFPDNYGAIKDIPSLIIIVAGNVYIYPSVKNISGIFIAQSSQAGEGYIYDCASGSTPVGTNQLYASCSNKLTVNGSFIANKVVLNRTNSSLRSASNTETNTSTNASEVFNYGPAYWINTSLPQSTSSSSSSSYDSLINLPPIL